MINALKISLIAYMFTALGREPGMIFNWYQRLIDPLPIWLKYPLGACFVCFCGQACLWYYVVTKPFNIIELLFFVSTGIFAALVYNRIYLFLNEY